MEMKFVGGLIIALIILGILIYFATQSHGLFEVIIEWFKDIVGL